MRLAPLDQLIGKIIIILGLGVEGRSTFEFVSQAMPDNTILPVDDQSIEQLDPFWNTALRRPHTQFHTSQVDLGDATFKTSVVFKTPGIPATHPVVQRALQHGATLLSNTQLFLELAAAANAAHANAAQSTTSQIRVIGVTGTKGKSTTTALIHHLLKKAGLSAFLGGNIGKPALSVWQELHSQLNQEPSSANFSGIDHHEYLHADPLRTAYAVLELSAHQLAELTISPEFAVVQDVTPEHLDYYASFEEYLAAKAHLTSYQTGSDVVIYNADSPTARQIADLSPGQRLGFSIEPAESSGQSVFAGRLTQTNDRHHLTIDSTPILAVSDVPLVGRHNLYNVFPALLIAHLLGIPVETIQTAVRSFASLPHRLELVRELNGVRYYDDSIATTPEAAMAALTAFADQPVILIAGGHDRHLDFGALAQQILQQHLPALALFSPTGDKLRTALERAAASTSSSPNTSINSSTGTNTGANTGASTSSSTGTNAGANTSSTNQLPILETVDSMSAAVAFATRHAIPGSVVLLSPAAASFGRFRDYRDRGDQFKAAVNALPSSV